jgi:hypothetical protein
MHTLIIQKSNNLIIQSRYDNATGDKLSLENVLASYVEDNNLDATTVEIVEIPFTKFTLTVGKHLFNKLTNTIDENPDWVEPARESDSGIPTTDSSTGKTVNG